MLLLGAAAAMVLVCGAGMLLFVIGLGGAARQVAVEQKVQEDNATAAAKQAKLDADKDKGTAPATMTREEFMRVIDRKTEKEIIALLGRPESTDLHSDGSTWRYMHRTVDSISGKTDYSVHIRFVDGVVNSVTF
ncbi:hypothetical protein FRUB_10260 [Fimbriiglobus ruber]|uniref:Uncharacterized protein n=2 Tax=Fimbriiglobus ruber TaxID=1908690 RepID=A0A225DAX7_9BACT|nr:hypothetical protein FRUB_10260 [Fimbriiglobus ruber]